MRLVKVPVAVIAAFAVSTAALSLFAVGAAVRARKASVRTGKESMVGAEVEVLGPPHLQQRIHTPLRYWNRAG